MKIVHKKFDFGYRAIDETSGLIVCLNCGDVLNQECRAPYDTFCPSCRFQINATVVVQQAKKLHII